MSNLKKKLNIVLAATGIASVANDFYLQEISQRLRKKGHRVWLVCFNPQNPSQYDLPIYWQGPKHKILWLLYVLCPYFWDRAMSLLVNQAIREIPEPLDIVDFEIPFLTYGYQKKGKEKLVIRAWYYPHHLFKRLIIMARVGPKNLIDWLIFMIRQFWFYFGDEFGYKKADSIVTLTPHLVKQLEKYGHRTAWIPRAIWVPLGIKIAKKLPKKSSPLVCLGSVVYDLENPRKGINLLLLAIKIIEEKKMAIFPYRVELIGNYTPRLNQMIKNLNLENKVSLPGLLPHKQVLTKLQDWDVFVFPTLFEELSMASVEAAAAGLACVGWEIDALTASWGNAAFLLPKGNTEILAESLAKLINNPELRRSLSQKAWERAKKYFAWEKVVGKLEKIYLSFPR